MRCATILKQVLIINEDYSYSFGNYGWSFNYQVNIYVLCWNHPIGAALQRAVQFL